jgi:G3E family GTPase
VIVLNKTDLVSEAELATLHGILKSLNTRARIVNSSFGKVPLDQLLDTGLFDFEAASAAPGWLKELRGEHVPESEEYGITSFVYRSRKPFHPERLAKLFAEEWPGVVRSKGYFWLASRHDLVGAWSQAGAVSRHNLAGRWWAAVPKQQWPEDKESREMIRSRSVEPFGDRQQELVLIGIGFDEATLRERLDACLLNDEELRLGPASWTAFNDPFPVWMLQEQVQEETA